MIRQEKLNYFYLNLKYGEFNQKRRGAIASGNDLNQNP